MKNNHKARHRMEANGRNPPAPEEESLLDKADRPPHLSRTSIRANDPLPPVEEDAPVAQPLLVIPPDGGYGWVIVVASFLANMMVDGIAYAYGILLVELVAYFEESKAKVASVGSLLCGIYLCTGPIAAAFVQLYGCRKVTIVGSVISCLGLALSVLATNVETLIFTYGVMGGFGFGLVYLPSTIIVNLYFEKRRSLAVGIAVCGSGFGAIVFAPFITLLLEFYDWKNVMLVLSGLMLNCAVFGALYRPLEPPAVNDTASTLDGLSNVGSSGLLASLRRRVGSTGSVERSRHTSACETGPGGEEQQRPRSANEERLSVRGPGAEADILKYVKEMNTVSEQTHASDNLLNASSDSKSLQRLRTQSECRSTSQRRLTDGFQARPNSSSNAVIYSTPNLCAKKSLLTGPLSSSPANVIPLPASVTKPEEYAKPMNRKDIFYTGSVFQMNRLGSMAAESTVEASRRSYLNIAASNQMIGSWIMSMTRLPSEDEVAEEERTCWQRLPKSLRDVIAQMTDFSLLRKWPYLFTWMGNVFFMIGYYVPFFLMVDFAVVHNNVPEGKASFLLSVIGISNTIGRVFFGWLVGQPRVSTLLVNNMTILLSGVITMLLPFCTIYPLMMTYAVFYGLLVAPVISLTSEILCDMFGIDKLTNAFGLLTLARGISASVGSPFAGCLYDATHRFDIPYFASGGVIIASASLFFLLHLPKFQRQMQINIKDMECQQLAVITSTSVLDQEQPQTSV